MAHDPKMPPGNEGVPDSVARAASSGPHAMFPPEEESAPAPRPRVAREEPESPDRVIFRRRPQAQVVEADVRELGARAGRWEPAAAPPPADPDKTLPPATGDASRQNDASPRLVRSRQTQPETERAIVEYRHIQKAFGRNVIYTDFTLRVFPGEVFTIIGGSGSGKSVALRILIGLLEPDAGQVFFEGRDLTQGMREADWVALRREVSMLFQSGALFDSLSVGENVAYALREHRRDLSEAEVADIVADRLERVGLPGVEHLRPAELSGGMRKRVGLARAIALEPKVILYDEPTTGLDPVNTNRINVLIRKIQAELGVTSIVVTHDMGTVRYVSDRVGMLHDKRVAFEDTLDELLRTDDPVVRDFVEGRFEGME